MRRVQLSSSGFCTSERLVSVGVVEPATMLNVPVRWRWMATSASVGRPVESGGPNWVSNVLCTPVIERQKRSGWIAARPAVSSYDCASGFW
jgi:hypothetical protein